MRQSLFDSWDYNVTLIAASAPQADYDAAVASSDVAYISEEIDAVDLGTKLRDAPIGVVNEGINLKDEFGFATGHGFPWPWLDAIQITNNQHHITSQFSLGLLTIFSAPMPIATISGTESTYLDKLGQFSASEPGLYVLEVGAPMHDVLPAAGRRVELPWGGNDTDIGLLTADGRTLMRRSLEWAASQDDPLIAHWNFDDVAGSIATDAVGNNNGALFGIPPWTTGQADGALDFDGNNDYVNVPANSALNISTDRTITGWFKLDSAFDSSSATSRIIIEKYLSDEQNMHIALVGTDHARTEVADGSL